MHSSVSPPCGDPELAVVKVKASTVGGFLGKRNSVWNLSLPLSIVCSQVFFGLLNTLSANGQVLISSVEIQESKASHIFKEFVVSRPNIKTMKLVRKIPESEFWMKDPTTGSVKLIQKNPATTEFIEVRYQQNGFS